MCPMREQYIYIFVVSHGSLLKISSTYTTLHISFANSAVGVYLVFLKGATLVESMFSLYHDDLLP